MNSTERHGGAAPHRAELTISKTRLGTTSVEVTLPNPEGTPPAEPMCPLCGGECVSTHSVEEFPFLSLGVVVRIANVLEHQCRLCGTVTSPAVVGDQVESVVGRITRKLEEARVGPGASPRKVKRILFSQPITPHAAV